MKMHFLFSRAALSCLVLTSLVLVSACSGSREATGPSEPADDLPTPAAQMSDYEDFDASVYREDALPPVTGIQHDVPEKLMQGTADTGVSSTVQGFRVQVFSTLDKNIAVQREEDLKSWWRSAEDTAPPGLFADDMSINVVYIQPYYRVRLGNFTSRQAAERARSFVAQHYPDAFIVPDTVTITR